MKRAGLAVIGITVVLLGSLFFLVNTRTGQDMALQRLIAAAMGTPDADFDGLQVFMCGTSSPLPATNRVQACVVVIAGQRIYVVDAGAGSARTVSLARLPLQNLQAVLLTHFHSDHIAAIPDFNLNSWVAGRSAPLLVMGPEGVEQVVRGFNIAYGHDRGYRVAHHGSDLLPPDLGTLVARRIEPGLIIDNGDLTVRAFVVEHSPVEPAVGFRFDYKGRSVVISGDSVVTGSLITAAHGADLLLHDAISLPIIKALEDGARQSGLARQAAILHDIQDYHAPVSDLPALAEAANVRQLAVYHLIPPPQNLLFERIFRRDLPADVIITEDGMMFELPAGSTQINVR